MYTIDYAYDLADQYTVKTDGYTFVGIRRWNFNHVVDNCPTIEYCLSSQAGQPETFKTIDALVERLKELLA